MEIDQQSAGGCSESLAVSVAGAGRESPAANAERPRSPTVRRRPTTCFPVGGGRARPRNGRGRAADLRSLKIRSKQMPEQNLQGKVVLVAGGAKNLGGLISRTLAADGRSEEHTSELQSP